MSGALTEPSFPPSLPLFQRPNRGPANPTGTITDPTPNVRFAPPGLSTGPTQRKKGSDASQRKVSRGSRATSSNQSSAGAAQSQPKGTTTASEAPPKSPKWPLGVPVSLEYGIPIPPDLGPLDFNPNAVRDHFCMSCPNISQVVDQAALDLIAGLVTTDLFTLYRSPTQRDVLVERSYRAALFSKSETMRESMEKGSSIFANL
jgi:hypothetical protein